MAEVHYFYESWEKIWDGDYICPQITNLNTSCPCNYTVHCQEITTHVCFKHAMESANSGRHIGTDVVVNSPSSWCGPDKCQIKGCENKL